MTLASVHVSDIGRSSLFNSIGGFNFGIGMMMEDYRGDETGYKCFGTSSCTKFLGSLFGMLSGPTAFATLSDDRDRNTSSLETKSSCGTRLGGESPVKGAKWSVRLTKSH